MIVLLLVTANINQSKIAEQRKAGRAESRRKSTDLSLHDGRLWIISSTRSSPLKLSLSKYRCIVIFWKTYLLNIRLVRQQMTLKTLTRILSHATVPMQIALAVFHKWPCATYEVNSWRLGTKHLNSTVFLINLKLNPVCVVSSIYLLIKIKS